VFKLIINKKVEGLREGGATDAKLQQCPSKEQLASWVEKLYQHDYTLQFYPKSNINENEWSKNHQMSDGNKNHEKHEKTLHKEN
jgi:hypothetical protein